MTSNLTNNLPWSRTFDFTAKDGSFKSYGRTENPCGPQTTPYGGVNGWGYYHCDDTVNFGTYVNIERTFVPSTIKSIAMTFNTNHSDPASAANIFVVQNGVETQVTFIIDPGTGSHTISATGNWGNVSAIRLRVGINLYRVAYITAASLTGIGINPFLTHQGPADCPCNYAAVDDHASGHPISLYLGEKREEATDLSVNTPGGALAFTRAYRQSKLTDTTYQFMGLGWLHNHSIQLTKIPGTPNIIMVRTQRGGEVYFTETYAGSNEYAGDPGSTSSIHWDGTKYTLTAQDKSQYVFDTPGQLSTNVWQITSLVQPSGETWSYSYDVTSKRLLSVTDTYGKALQFSYISNPSQYNDGQLWRVGDQAATGLSGSSPAGRYVEFGYIQEKLNGSTTGNLNSLLVTVRDVRGNVWTYNYYGQAVGETDANQKNFLTERRSPVVDTTGSGLVNSSLSLHKTAYTLSGTTITGITQSRGNGLTRTNWAFQPQGQNITTETTAAKVTTHRFDGNIYAGSQDPEGNFSSRQLDDQFRPAVQTDPKGNQTNLTWSSDGKYLNQVQDPLGHQTNFNYNVGGTSDGTLDYSLDAQGHKTQYTYGDTNNPRLPTRMQVYDADGVTILRWQEFTYDTAGRTLTEQVLDPASQGTVVLQQVDRAYYTSGNGNGLLKMVTQRDLTNPANDVTVTYFYDSAGRVIRTNQSAAFGTCTSAFTLYDAADNILASICNYDPGDNADPTTLAQLLALYNPAYPDQNRITAYEYDPLGRRIKSITDAGTPYALTTLLVYDALDRVVRTIGNYVPSAAVSDPYVHHRLDFPHGVNNDQNLIVDLAYNERGLVSKQTDVAGLVTLFGYDDAGRLVKTIQSASQPTYDNSYGLNGDPTLSRYVPSAAPDQDIITTAQYDPAGNLIKVTDALGNMTFTVYDALNRPVKTVRSASQPNYNLLVDPTLSQYPFSPTADQDLLETVEYDSLGRVRRSQDVLGTWTLYGYDALSRAVRTIRNASQPNYNLTLDPALSNYLISDAVDQDLITQAAYDAAGRLMNSADVLNRLTWTAYDGLGRVIRTVTNATGIATDGGGHDPRSATYGAVDNQSDRDLIALTRYDSDGRVLWMQDPLGRKSWAAYDSLGRTIQTVVNALGTATDGSPSDPRSPFYRASSAPDQDIVTRTVYNSQGRVAMTVDALGNQTQYTYDALGRVIKTIDNFVTGTYNANRPDQDLSSTTAYDVAGRVSATVDARGTQTTFAYDRAGRQVKVTQAANTSLATTSYTCYDKGGRVLRTIQNWVTDPTQPSPDARDNSGNFLFNPAGHGAANDQNLITTYTLDRLGRMTAGSDPVGNMTSTIYYKDGTVESVTDPIGMVSKYRYDGVRRRTTVVQGYLASTYTDPATWTWSTANVRWQDGSGSAIAFGSLNDTNIILRVEYDKAGRMTAVRDTRGNRTTYTYDLLDRRTSLTDPLSHTWATAYATLNGTTQTTQTDPLGNATLRSTDLLGRLKTIQYLNESPKLTPDVTFTYDKGGNRRQMSESDGTTPVRITNYSYDQASRLNQVSFDLNGDGLTIQTVNYQYDAGGLRTKLTLPGNLAVNYTYNQRGQLVSLTDWASQQTSYAYDNDDRLVAATQSNGLLSQYQYDPAGRLRLLRHTKNDKTFGHFAYSVDARGNRTQVYEAVAQAVTGTVTYAYNDDAVNLYAGTWAGVSSYQTTTDTSAGLQLAFFGKQATLTMGQGSDHSIYDVYLDGDLWQSVDGYASSAGPVDLTLSLTGDGPHVLDIRNRPNKNLASSGYQLRFKKLVVTGTFADLQTLRYSYDALSRLQDAKYYPGLNTSLADASLPRRYQYGYDTVGNRTQQIATLAGTPTTTTYTYDAANRLQSDGTHTYTFDAAGRMTSDGVHSLTWDRANRLLSYNGPSYAYDGEGNRIKQTVGANTTQYLLDIQPSLAQVWFSTTGANIVRQVHTPTGVQAVQDSAGNWHPLVKDALGSVRQTLTVSLSPEESRLYEPYGKQLPYGSGSTGNNKTDFGFTGEQTDPNELVYLRARYMHPTAGVFLSKDPVEGVMSRLMSRNGYSYVEGNPATWTDPSGEIFGIDDLAGAAAGSIIGQVTGAVAGFGGGVAFLAAAASGACGCDLKKWADSLGPADIAGIIIKTTGIAWATGGLVGALAGAGPLGWALAGSLGIASGVDNVIKAIKDAQARGANACNIAQGILGGIGIVTGAVATASALTQIASSMPSISVSGGPQLITAEGPSMGQQGGLQYVVVGGKAAAGATSGEVVNVVAANLADMIAQISGHGGSSGGWPSIADRVFELRVRMGKASDYVTAAVADATDKEGIVHRLISLSGDRLFNSRFPKLAFSYEEIVPPQGGTGHAEDNIALYVKEKGWKLGDIGATRPICTECEASIKSVGGNPVTPLKGKP